MASSSKDPVIAHPVVGSKRKADEESAVKSRLECAICMNIMFPPIRQCAEGHNFCNKCSTKLMTGTEASARKCPTCRTPLEKPVARARNLEQWATEADVEVVCDHEDCGETFRYSQYNEHKKTCVGCSVQCPKAGCKWRGEPKDLAAHLTATEGEHAHKLAYCPNAAKFSRRHRDYSTTVIFETNRKVGHKRRWRPPRQLIAVPANPKLGTEACTFVVALWKEKGANEAFIAAISSLRKPGHEETPWSYDISLSAYPRPPQSMCVSRASACGPVGDLDAKEVWARPKLAKCKHPVLATDAASMAIFNTANLDTSGNVLPEGSDAQRTTQRYELHVRLMPITPESDREREAREAEDDDTPLHEMMREEMMRDREHGHRARGGPYDMIEGDSANGTDLDSDLEFGEDDEDDGEEDDDGLSDEDDEDDSLSSSSSGSSHSSDEGDDGSGSEDESEIEDDFSSDTGS